MSLNRTCRFSETDIPFLVDLWYIPDFDLPLSICPVLRLLRLLHPALDLLIQGVGFESARLSLPGTLFSIRREAIGDAAIDSP